MARARCLGTPRARVCEGEGEREHSVAEAHARLGLLLVLDRHVVEGEQYMVACAHGGRHGNLDLLQCRERYHYGKESDSLDYSSCVPSHIPVTRAAMSDESAFQFDDDGCQEWGVPPGSAGAVAAYSLWGSAVEDRAASSLVAAYSLCGSAVEVRAAAAAAACRACAASAATAA